MIRRLIMNNIGLKILAVILALVTWFYIYAELRKGTIEERGAAFSFLRYKVISKRLPVKVILAAGALPEEFTIDEENIAVTPDTMHVIGPQILLKDVDYAMTLPIDVTEHRKPFEIDVMLAPIAEGISLENESVRVTVPIIRKEE